MTNLFLRYCIFQKKIKSIESSFTLSTRNKQKYSKEVLIKMKTVFYQL